MFQTDVLSLSLPPPHITPHTKQSFTYFLFFFYYSFSSVKSCKRIPAHFISQEKKEREETFFYKPQRRQILIFFLTSTHPILWSEHLWKLFHRGFQKMFPPEFALKSAGILADGRNHIHTHWLREDVEGRSTGRIPTSVIAALVIVS